MYSGCLIMRFTALRPIITYYVNLQVVDNTRFYPLVATNSLLHAA